ncbi:MAG: DUF302 domain-containing protein [Acidiferrobacteraceae bacterium]
MEPVGVKRLALGLALLTFSTLALAGENVFVLSVRRPIGPTFRSVVSGLSHSGFKVVKRINIGKKLAGAARRFHWKDYNENHLQGIRSVVFCNGKFANAIGNADPAMLAVCPLHLTLVQQGDLTRIEFVKPAAIARGTKAEGIARRLQQKIIAAIHKGLAAQ